MPPSTKNLRERIDGLLRGYALEVLKTSKPPAPTPDEYSEAISNLLTSELSLAVKGLRESLEEQVRLRERNAIHAINGELAEEMQMKLNVSKFDLQAFDSKAKEILGVLTHED